jgi:hypothetical protein
LKGNMIEYDSSLIQMIIPEKRQTIIFLTLSDD